MKIKNYQENTIYVLNGIREKIKTITDGKENDFEKDYMKIKFNSDDNLPLNKTLKFHNMTITIISVFEENGKLYLQVFLDDTLYELNLLEYDRIDISEGIAVIKDNSPVLFQIKYYILFTNRTNLSVHI